MMIYRFWPKNTTSVGDEHFSQIIGMTSIRKEPVVNQLNHHDYYLTRAQASRALSHQASNPKIAAIHSELASRYDSLVAQFEQPGANTPTT